LAGFHFFKSVSRSLAPCSIRRCRVLPWHERMLHPFDVRVNQVGQNFGLTGLIPFDGGRI
jgi:hypothetical protein